MYADLTCSVFCANAKVGDGVKRRCELVSDTLRTLLEEDVACGFAASAFAVAALAAEASSHHAV